MKGRGEEVAEYFGEVDQKLKGSGGEEGGGHI